MNFGFYILLTVIILFNSISALSLNNIPDSTKIIETKVKNSKDSLSEIIFNVENSEAAEETGLLNSCEDGFEEDLIKSIINYKHNKFSETYKTLFAYLVKYPEALKYFEYLAKTANITNKSDELKNFIQSSNRKDELIYLAGLIDYFETNYKSAVVKFSQAHKVDSKSIDIQIYLSNSYRRVGNYKEAFHILRTAQNLVNSKNSHYAEILIAKGSLQYLSGKYEDAQTTYKLGLEASEKSNNLVEMIKAELNLAMINDLNGNIDNARKLFEKCYKLAVKINQKELEATVLSEWAVSYTYTNEPIIARNKYEESFVIFELFNNHERLALISNNIANLFLNIGNYKSALDNYNYALNTAVQNPRIQMDAYRGLGDVYTNLSNYAKALNYYTKAKEISKEIKDINSEAEINTGMGTLYYNLGEPEKALRYLFEKYDEVKEAELPYLKAELNQKLGIIYTSLQDYKNADKFLSESIHVSDNYDDIYSSITSKTYLAYSFIQQNDLKRGREILEEQLKLCKKNNLNQLSGLQLLILSETYTDNKKFNLLNEALKYATVANDKSNMIDIYYSLGKYYAGLNQDGKAEENYLHGISIIENQLTELRNYNELQIKYFSNNYKVYTSLVDLYLKENELKKAFNILDKSRSRNTLYNLQAIKLHKMSDSGLVNKYYDLRWKLNNELKEKTDKDSVLISLAKTEKLLNQKHSEFGEQLKNNTELNVESYFRDLNKNEYFITYYTNSGNIYAIVASNKKLDLIKLDASPDEVTNIISLISPYYNKKLRLGDVNFNKDLFSFNPDAAFNLFRKVLEPVLKMIPENSELILSLPSELAKIPYEFLCTEKRVEPGTGYYGSYKYLIEQYSISYSPSYSIWRELKSRSVGTKQTALLAGDPALNNLGDTYSDTRGIKELDFYSRDIKMLPLRYSSQEIEDVDEFFDDDIILLKEEATETNFKKYSESASIIHLSTHSFLFKNYPVIIFAQDDKNDGYLETGEVAELKLNSDLVVLSSCKSGLGKTDDAEGVLGMQKVLFDAGALSVVLSLWDVSDKQTSVLMKNFYEYLNEGLNKSEALRYAKIKFINENDANPYYWAAFTLAGRSDSVLLKTQSNSYKLYFLLLLFLLVGLLVWKKRIFVR